MPVESRLPDLATELGNIRPTKPARVIAVTSGKGGVGKTNVSVNLAMSLCAQGKKVVLMDADLGLANVDVLLGLNTQRNLEHVINGECSLEDVITLAPQGLQIVPAASGIAQMANLGAVEQASLIQAFSELNHRLDVLIVDTAAGISSSVLSFSRASQEVIVVVCDEPASITDAYAMIKVLSRDHGQNRFHVLANMVHSAAEGQELFRKLVRVTDRFLDVVLNYMGAIPYDEYIRKAVQRQRAVVDAYPRSKAATAFKKIAQTADKWPMTENPAGHLQFFFEQLVERRGEETPS